MGSLAMTKAREQRVKNSLERTRVKLKQRSIELESAEKALIREREDLRAERAEAIALLQVLCEQYGETDWEPDAQLAWVIEHKLMEPIMRRVAKLLARLGAAEQPSRAVRPPKTPAAPPPAPARPRLRAVDPLVHRAKVVPVQGREGGTEYRVICTCPNWYRLVPTQAEGWRIAQEHEQDGTGRALRQSAR